MNLGFLSVAGDIKAGGTCAASCPAGSGLGALHGAAWERRGRCRRLRWRGPRAFSAPWLGFTAGRSPIGQLEELGLSECLESLLRSAGGETEAQEDAGACQTPPAARVQSTRRPGPPGKRKHPLSSQENFTGQFRKPPHLLPFPPVDNGALYFLPSQQQPPPLRMVGPERTGNAGHTSGTLWADLCLQAQKEGSCGRVTRGMRFFIPQPCPTHSGDQTEAPIFQRGTLRLPGVAEVTKFPHQAFFREENPISGAQGVGKGHTGDKGLVIASLRLFTLCTGGAGPAVPSGPESPSVPRRARGLSQGQD